MAKLAEMRIIYAIAAAALGLTMSSSFITGALAASPHFIGTPTCTKSSAGLTCSFKAAGLGNVATNVFLTASSVSGLYQCVNPGGNSPPPKQFTFTNLQGPTVTVTPRNGQITASPTLPAPPNPTATQLGCPNPHWTVALIGPLTYTNVVLHIQQGSTDILTFNFGTIDP